MAELSAAAPGWAASSERDALLATKLHVPRPQPGFVLRPRLVQELEDGLARRLVLVCGPAGFGKTALLAHWAQSGGRPVAWLSLDAADNDPVRFWRHAIGALDRLCPGIGDAVGPLLGPPAPASFEGLVTVLINELAAQPGGDKLLVLDDYHLVDAPAVHGSVMFLVEHVPPGLHLVLASRSDPPLPLARLRGRGQLAELRADDLRFTPDEAASLLREATGADLPGTAVAALAARTEGWAAGLQLAGLSLRGHSDPAGFVSTFSGSHRYVLDYLTQEVLERQTEQVRQFLLETSVLDRQCGALCDAVTGRADSQAMLEAIERASLFLLPLDEVRGWWRYHHLFADLLRARLQREQPGRVPALHRSAAAWYEEHGLADDAVRHAVAAGDMTRAARLVEQHFDARFRPGERATIQRWLAALPAELVRSRRRLLLAQTWMALVAGDVAGTLAPLDAAERLPADTADDAFEPSVGTAGSHLANIPAVLALARAFLAHLRGDAEDTAAFASRALAGLAEGEWLLDAVARWQLSAAEWLCGSLDEAERGFASVIARCQAAGERGLAAASCHLLGQVQQSRGRLDAALGTYRQALEVTAPPGRPALPAAGIAYAGMAEIAYQRNDLDAALGHVTEGIAACRQLNYTSPLATGLAALARIRQANGDPAGALEAIGEAERAGPGADVTALLNPVPAVRARLLLAQGQITATARWVRQRGLGPDDEPDHPREREYLVLARVLLAQHRPGPALGLLDRLHAAATGQGRTGSVIEIQALRGLALAAAGDGDAAVSALAVALTLACRQGYIRVFADEGTPMAALLGRLVAAQKTEQAAVRGVPLAYLARLLRAFGQEPAAQDPGQDAAAVPGLAEQLTARELEVLVLLAAGMPNPRIADELVVTLDTVKKHVSHLLGKLGAANRTEAVTRARELGLVR